MTGSRHDQLVEQWLAAVRQEGADLPPEALGELLADLREHIEVARADLPAETEAEVRTILERLGDPSMIVAEARGGSAPSDVGPGAGPARSRVGTWVIVLIVTVGLLCVAGCLAGVLGLVSWTTLESGDPVPSPLPTSR